MNARGLSTSGLAANEGAAASAYSPGIVTVTIDHTKVGASTHTDFVLLFCGTYSILKSVANGGAVANVNGYDMVFYSDLALTTKLSFHRIVWDATSGYVEFRVKVPSISSSVDTVIYLAVGQSSVTTEQQDQANTYATAIKAFWHLNEGQGTTLADATSNAYDLTATGVTVGASGKITRGVTIDGANGHYLSRTWTPALSYNSAFSISMLIKRSASGTRYDNLVAAMYYQTSVTADGWTFYIGSDNLLHYVNQNVADTTADSGTLTDTTRWYHIAMSYNSGTVKFYVDGALVGTKSAGTMSTVHNGIYFFIGDNETDNAPSTGNIYRGSLDAPRLVNAVRSTDWFLAEANNELSPSTFYSVSSAAPFTSRRRLFITFSN